MRFSFPITKTEKLEDGRLLIEGVATSEALDSQGDILDYEGSKQAFGKWRGNLREAHDSKKPVGKALEVLHDDDAKAISVRAFVSAGAADTQAKVMDGTLAMFSVGGEAPKKTKTEKVGGKLARRVLEWDMVELSLVDVGANPDAAFSLAKGAEASEAISECDTAKACEIPGHAEMTPEEHAKAHEEVPAEKAAEAAPGPVEATLEPPPVVLPAPAEKAAEPILAKYDGMAAFDIRLALDCLAMLEQLMSLESGEAGQGKPEPPKQMKALAAACAALKEFVASEAQELLEAPVKARGIVVMKFEAAPPQEIDLDVLAAKVVALFPLQKSAPAPEADVRIDALLKTVDEIKAGNGDLKVIRDGVEKMLAQPVPGRAPVRFDNPETIAKSVSNISQRIRVLEDLAASADAVARPAIERELAFARAQSGVR